MSRIVYGTDIAQEMRSEMKRKTERWTEEGKRLPCLAVILAGDNPASLSYVKGKEKACKAVGVRSIMHKLPSNVSQEELEEVIQQCSNDPDVDAVLVQLPLPEGLNADKAILRIDPSKDVDGLHPVNIGNLYLGRKCFAPCTPSGIMIMLEKMGCNPDGKRAVVLGRSRLVGTPVSRLLTNANATVTLCHSHTKNVQEIAAQADILIAAVGHPRMVTRDYIKKGAFVIDVGVNRLEDGRLCGDVDFDNVQDLAEAITPVPKGVGPMTITMLLDNTIKAYEERML